MSNCFNWLGCPNIACNFYITAVFIVCIYPNSTEYAIKYTLLSFFSLYELIKDNYRFLRFLIYSKKHILYFYVLLIT